MAIDATQPTPGFDDPAGAIERERAALYLRQRPLLQLGNIALQLTCAALLARTQPLALLGLWVAMNVALMIVRGSATRRLAQGLLATAEEIRQWFRSLTLAVLIGGVIWGGGAYVFLDMSDPVRLSVLLLLFMGVSWGAVASLSVHFPAVVAFIAPLCVLTAIKLATFGTHILAMLALLTVAFMAFTLITARNYGQSVDATFRLGVENLRLLAQVTSARDAAERTSSEKSRFLAALSHDVRQPLYAAGLFLESLGARLTNSEQRNVYDNAATALNSVDELFSAVLEISQLENAPPPTALQTFDLAAIAAALKSEFAVDAARGGVELRVVTEPVLVRSDPVLVARVLRNLISNALKHTRTGYVEVLADVGHEVVTIRVRDTGVGIASADHARIFDEYYQLDNPGRDHRRGLGLGLAVVRRICELLETKIELVSAPEEGATFSFRLPVGAASELRPRAPDRAHYLAGIHVLFIEDDDAVRAGLALMLRDWQCQVSAGPTLDDALACANALDRPVDIVLSDYRLGGDVTGIDAIRSVRERFDPSLPALILTGESDVALTDESAAAGVPILRKPVAATRLHEAIGRAIS